MSGGTVLLVYCAAIAAASIAGGVATQKIRVTHLGMQLLMSLVGGLILGVAILHMLPHAIAVAPSALGAIMIATLAGVLVMLLMMRLFHVHQHRSDDLSVAGSVAEHVGCSHDTHAHPVATNIVKTADHACSDPHDHVHDHAPVVAIGRPPGATVSEPAAAPPSAGASVSAAQRLADQAATMRWFGLAIGMTVHSLLDGVAVAAYVAAERPDGALWHWPGLGIFLAILLHKPLDASSIVWLMRTSGWSRQAMVAVNLLFAAMTPLGVALFHFGVQGSSLASAGMLAVTLGFSAGVFLCISLSDILPEVQFHSHDRAKLTTALLVGVLLAWLVGLAEPHSAHSITPAEPSDSELLEPLETDLSAPTSQP